MDVKINANFTKMLNDLNPESGMDIIGADEIGPQSASVFEEKIACGGMVLVAGDRTPAIDSSKNIILPFLGKDAPFSSGIFYLTSLMNASVYFVFGLRRGELAIRSGYDMHVHKSNIVFNGSRKERKEQTVRLAASFASFLEIYCKKHPFQWYNFFNFWQDKEKS
jgi:predicted LPLAT superfamily acyltransferase